jgi:uncharacterized protein (DUF305 family)
MGSKVSNLKERAYGLSGKRSKILAGLAALILLGLITETGFYAGEETGDSPAFNRADVMFMNMMIIHHDQAIEMAELAENKTENKNILELSGNISEAQRAENRQMVEWLGELGYQRPEDGHRMAGMASQEQMNQLENSTDKEFDRLFSELMITHHRGGINMAQSFSQRGSHPELINLEEKMIETQQKEIRMMQNWQRSWNQ